MAEQTENQDQVETNQQMERYLDALIANQGAMAEALESARKRSLAASEKISAALCARQREALELTKKVAMNPDAYSENAKAMLKAATDAQSRALDFAKDLYKEQSDVGADVRATWKSLFESSKEAAQAATDLARAWNANNPMAAAVKKSVAGLRS